MVIGNLTQTEESAIHGEQTERGGIGDPGRWWLREGAQMLRVPLPERGGRGRKKTALAGKS